MGKQGWCLIEYPLSLVDRDLNGIYYLDITFFQAKIGHSPSYVWHRNMKAQDLITQGLFKRIGYSTTTSVYSYGPFVAKRKSLCGFPSVRWDKI